MDLDPDWTVRAALAETLAELERPRRPAAALAALDDPDPRAIPPCCARSSASRRQASTRPPRAADERRRDGAATAARLLGELKPAAAAPALAAASTPAATIGLGRAGSALEALVALKAERDEPISDAQALAIATGRRACARVRPARLDPASTAEPERPAPLKIEPEGLHDADRAARVAARVHRHQPGHDRDRAGGARRADHEPQLRHAGAQGLLQRPAAPTACSATSWCRTAIRAATATAVPAIRFATSSTICRVPARHVGMALAGKDTGGSQFFITHSPQPHLDAKYTAFGRVVAGMDVVDRLQQGDTIDRVRVWDGVTMSRRLQARRRRKKRPVRALGLVCTRGDDQPPPRVFFSAERPTASWPSSSPPSLQPSSPCRHSPPSSGPS